MHFNGKFHIRSVIANYSKSSCQSLKKQGFHWKLMFRKKILRPDVHQQYRSVSEKQYLIALA